MLEIKHAEDGKRREGHVAGPSGLDAAAETSLSVNRGECRYIPQAAMEKENIQENVQNIQELWGNFEIVNKCVLGIPAVEENEGRVE